MTTGICRDCYHYNRLGAGCAAGPTVINPNESETCRLNPPQFPEKPRDTRGWELRSPVEWHLTGQKPKGEEVTFTTRKGKEVSFRKGKGKPAGPRKGGKKK